jgi:hypothetical protein
MRAEDWSTEPACFSMVLLFMPPHRRNLAVMMLAPHK